MTAELQKSERKEKMLELLASEEKRLSEAEGYTLDEFSELLDKAIEAQ